MYSWRHFSPDHSTGQNAVLHLTCILKFICIANQLLTRHNWCKPVSPTLMTHFVDNVSKGGETIVFFLLQGGEKAVRS